MLIETRYGVPAEVPAEFSAKAMPTCPEVVVDQFHVWALSPLLMECVVVAAVIEDRADDPPPPHPVQLTTVRFPAESIVALVDPRFSVPPVAEADSVVVPEVAPFRIRDPAVPDCPRVRAPVEIVALALPDTAFVEEA